jgi:hypothetical protein
MTSTPSSRFFLRQLIVRFEPVGSLAVRAHEGDRSNVWWR